MMISNSRLCISYLDVIYIQLFLSMSIFFSLFPFLSPFFGLYSIGDSTIAGILYFSFVSLMGSSSFSANLH